MTALSASTEHSYRQVADWLRRCVETHASGVPVIGINGAQGSGKSTLAHWLTSRLRSEHGVVGAVVSLDDFYRTRAEREQLAREVHPLLLTRGVPGTHDAALGCLAIEQLQSLGAGQELILPRFDKAADDRAPAGSGEHIVGPVDYILFEGWCVGVPPQSPEALVEPVNALERQEDQDCRWRRYVNTQLAGAYADWFGRCDGLIQLAVPSWEQVFEWRRQQERETAQAAGGHGAGLMDDAALRRFMAHYERLTRHALATLPALADVSLRLDPAHSVHIEHMAPDGKQ